MSELPAYAPIPQQIEAERCQTRTAGKQRPIAAQLILSNEIQASCGCINGIIETYNKLYRFGYLFTFSLLLLVTLILAPVFGFIAAVLDGVFMLVRMVLRPIGKMVADVLGFGTIVALKSEQIQRELDV